MEFSPGVSPKASIDFFTLEEQEIISSLTLRDWYITRAESIKIAASSYKVILMKPSDLVKNAFNINREIVVAFSPTKLLSLGL